MNLHENSMTGGASPTLPTILHDATNRPPSSSLAMFKVRHVSSSAAGCRENSGLCAGVGSICLHPYYIYGIFIIQSWVSNILILYTYTYIYIYHSAALGVLTLKTRLRSRDMIHVNSSLQLHSAYGFIWARLYGCSVCKPRISLKHLRYEH